MKFLQNMIFQLLVVVGISTWEDAVEFFLAGASAVQLGSAIGDNWVGVI